MPRQQRGTWGPAEGLATEASGPADCWVSLPNGFSEVTMATRPGLGSKWLDCDNGSRMLPGPSPVPPFPPCDPFWKLRDKPSTVCVYILKEINQLPSIEGALDTEEERGVVGEEPTVSPCAHCPIGTLLTASHSRVLGPGAVGLGRRSRL